MTLILTCWSCTNTVKIKGGMLPEGWKKKFGSFGAEYFCPGCINDAQVSE